MISCFLLGDHHVGAQPRVSDFFIFSYQGLFGVVLEGDGHVRAQQTVVENAIAMRMT